MTKMNEHKDKFRLTENNFYALREEYRRGIDSGINYSEKRKLNVNPELFLGRNIDRQF